MKVFSTWGHLLSSMCIFGVNPLSESSVWIFAYLFLVLGLSWFSWVHRGLCCCHGHMRNICICCLCWRLLGIDLFGWCRFYLLGRLLGQTHHEYVWFGLVLGIGLCPLGYFGYLLVGFGGHLMCFAWLSVGLFLVCLRWLYVVASFFTRYFETNSVVRPGHVV